MTDAFVSIDDQRCTAVRLHVPNRGPWYAEVDLETAPDVGPRCTLRIGKTIILTGTIVSEQAGVFGQQRKLRLVAGAGGWGEAVASRAYHNDAGVKAVLVAQDAARDCGETIGQFVPARERLGVDYVRDSGSVASQVLDHAIGTDVLWWVGFDGVTNVGQRPTAAALVDRTYQVLAYDPRDRVATLSLDDPGLVQIGTVLGGASLPAAQTVREYEVQVDAQSVRVLAWCGGDQRSAGRLAGLWRILTERVADDALFGLYRYRLVSMAGDGRCSLQAVRKAAGLPDIEPISQWPGVAGAHAELTPGAEVLVAFVEGDRTQPVVTHYAGKDGTGFVPVSLTLGGEPAELAARKTDQVEVLMPPMVFVGLINGLSATGIVTSTLQTALGQITTGSVKVRIG